MAEICTIYFKGENFPFSHTWCFHVGADFCAVQREAGLVKNHEKWQNHDKPKFVSSSQCLAMWTWWRKTLREWRGAGQCENSTKANQIPWRVVEINEEMGQKEEGSKWWWWGAYQCCMWLPMVKVVALASWLAVWWAQGDRYRWAIEESSVMAGLHTRTMADGDVDKWGGWWGEDAI